MMLRVELDHLEVELNEAEELVEGADFGGGDGREGGAASQPAKESESARYPSGGGVEPRSIEEKTERLFNLTVLRLVAAAEHVTLLLDEALKVLPPLACGKGRWTTQNESVVDAKRLFGFGDILRRAAWSCLLGEVEERLAAVLVVGVGRGEMALRERAEVGAERTAGDGRKERRE